MSSVKVIYAGIRALGIAEEDDRRDLYERVTGKRRLREMTPADKDNVVGELRRLGFKHASGRRQLTGPFAKKLQALWIAAWNLGIAKSREDGALLAFVRRQTGIEDTRFLQDAKQAERVIEALKSWLAREGGVDWSTDGARPNWLKKNPGARIALAQYAILSPDARGLGGLSREIGKIVGAEKSLHHLTVTDWRAVQNAFGERIRTALKGA